MLMIERGMCDKTTGMFMPRTEHRLSAGEKLIYGVLKYGGDKADKHTLKEAANELNDKDVKGKWR